MVNTENKRWFRFTFAHNQTWLLETLPLGAGKLNLKETRDHLPREIVHDLSEQLSFDPRSIYS